MYFGEGAFPWIMGLISGYPMGAKISSVYGLRAKLVKLKPNVLFPLQIIAALFILGAVSAGILSSRIGVFINCSLSFFINCRHTL